MYQEGIDMAIVIYFIMACIVMGGTASDIHDAAQKQHKADQDQKTEAVQNNPDNK
jgi:hypothetical protein